MTNIHSSLMPHRRYNALNGDWILVSPQRTQRPWQGKKEKIYAVLKKAYDPSCYMCPGNKRANGEVNPDYESTYVFRNDFPALVFNSSTDSYSKGLLQSESVSGECKVVSFLSRHDLTLADMTIPEIEKVIRTWISELIELNKKYRWSQVFENKGELMGCSNPHPHGQIWAGDYVPTELKKEDYNQQQYFQNTENILLIDYLIKEIEKKERLVYKNDSWSILVPFWATWPYEILLLPNEHFTNLSQLNSKDILLLAEIIKKLLTLYNKLFNTSMPYSMGWHFAPNDKMPNTHWQLHAHYYPPLLRSANIKKFMVGYEMLAEPQRDITPEQAAEKLRSLDK